MLCLILAAASRSQAGEDASALAQFIAQASGKSRGMALVIGEPDGNLTAALATGHPLTWQACTWSAQALKSGNENLLKAGCLERASIVFVEANELPYADNLVNLVVSAAWGDIPATPEEVLRILAPGGVAVLGNDKNPGSLAALPDRLRKAGISDVQSLSRSGWIRFTKPANSQFDEWTHRSGSADLSSVNADQSAGPWEELRWVADPRWGALYVSYLGRVTGGGRLYYEENRAAANDTTQTWLIARDAYNGLELWRIPLGDAFKQSYHRQDESLACDERMVYAVNGKALTAWNGDTGKAFKEYAPGFLPVTVTAIESVLLASSKTRMAALDKETGQVLWSRSCSTHPAAQNGVAFVLNGLELEAVDLRSGSTRWKSALDEAQGDPRVFGKGTLVYVHRKPQYKPKAHLTVLDQKTGKPVWKTETTQGGYGVLPFRDELWLLDRDNENKKQSVAAEVLDPLTGKAMRTFRADGTVGAHCYAPKGSANFLLYSDSWYLNRKSDTPLGLDTVRSPCRLGQMPANGLTYFLPHHCDCGVYLRGLLALAPGGQRTWLTAEGQPRLFSAGSPPAKESDHAEDWPIYRGGMRRSNAAASILPASVKPLWSAKLGRSKLTQATIAYGMAFVAEPSTRSVMAVDAITGKPRWTYVADGKVDFAPALHQGLCLFSTHAGTVYALDAKTGLEVWRLRAAPTQKFIVDEGVFASAWPVIGGVLPIDGTIYFTCGRALNVDGGLRLFAVEASSGKVIWRTKGGTSGDFFLSDGQSLMLTEVYYQTQSGLKLGRQKDFKGLLHTTNYLSQVSIADYMACVEPSLSSNKHIELTNGYVTGENLAFDEKTSVAAWRYRFGVPAAMMKKEKKGERFLYARSGQTTTWCLDEGIRQQMMGVVLSGERVYFAGVPISQDSKEACELWVLDAASGKRTQVLPLEHHPAYDGLSAAHGRLYMASEEGVLTCLGQ